MEKVCDDVSNSNKEREVSVPRFTTSQNIWISETNRENKNTDSDRKNKNDELCSESQYTKPNFDV